MEYSDRWTWVSCITPSLYLESTMICSRFFQCIVAVILAVGFHEPLGKPAAATENGDPRRPPAITTQDVPVVSKLVERLNQYMNVRSAAFVGWAPDGSGILIRTRFGRSSQLHRVYQPGGR